MRKKKYKRWFPYNPFSNGSMYQDWFDSNCVRCVKGNLNTGWEVFPNPCPLQYALDGVGFRDDKGLDRETWLALGGSDTELFMGDCTQFETEGQRDARLEAERRVEYNKHQIDLLGDVE